MPLDIAASLTSSLSGPLTDYIVREQLHTGTREPVWSAKVCYQQKFQEGQQKLCLSEMRLREAEEKLVKMDQITNDRETCLATMEVYSRLEKSMILTSLFSVHNLTIILCSRYQEIVFLAAWVCPRRPSCRPLAHSYVYTSQCHLFIDVSHCSSTCILGLVGLMEPH